MSPQRYDEHDVERYDRPRRRTRPRTKDRPSYDDAVPARVITVDRGRYTCMLEDGVLVTAMKSRPLGRKGVVVGDAVRLVGDVSGDEGSLARIVEVDQRHTVLRRTAAAADNGDTIRVGREVVLDVPRLALTIDDRPITLTATEFQLLAVMARQPGRVFTRSQLLDAVHGVAFESYERAIDAHVKNIRRKLETDPARPRYLLTVFGVGYRLAEQPTTG